MKDTLRILITPECNLHCTYCCNHIPEVQARFEFLPWHRIYDMLPFYPNICITGGEPLLELNKVFKLLKLCPGKNVYLYTNGLYLNAQLAQDLLDAGVTGFNIGVHPPYGPCDLPSNLFSHPAVRYTFIRELEDEYSAFIKAVCRNNAKWVTLNDCDTPNEKIVVAY